MALGMVRWITLITMMCLCCCGCSDFQSALRDDDADISDLDYEGDENLSDESDEEVAENQNESDTQPTFSARTPSSLEKHVVLKVGDRFPFLKTMEHQLTQIDEGVTQVSSSRTEIHFSLVVEIVATDGRKRLLVEFQNVQHEQSLLNQRITYSSDKPNVPVPTAALLYAGLVNNGFSFWIGSDNQVLELVDYPEFLRRCLRNVPQADVGPLQQQLDQIDPAGAVESFVDESMGLFAAYQGRNQDRQEAKKGATWELEPQRFEAPVPMSIHTRCLLKEISPNAADILLSGKIAASEVPSLIRDDGCNLKIFVRGGHTSGSCRIHPQTGIPVQSEIQRTLDLIVEMEDGHQIQQTKDARSSLASIPARSSNSSIETQIQQTGFQRNGTDLKNRPVVRSVQSRQN
jgi:hypothetical protein